MRIDVKQEAEDITILSDDLPIKSRAIEYQAGMTIFAQGDLANYVFTIKSGAVKLSVVSVKGKEAVVAVLGAGDLFGEGTLLGRTRRSETARALMPTSVGRIQKPDMLRMLQERHDFSHRFLTYVLRRNIRIQESLVDQLFNSTEKRLARVLLLLTRHSDQGTNHSIADVPQSTLAEMIGATRPHVNYYLNRFRSRGLIKYNGGLHVERPKLMELLRD
jgi:CRP/FNR family transcriptional regulator, cyclic AMP receptor protein